MAKLVIHAGMGKTGSSSIQRWLSKHSHTLDQKYNLKVLKVNTHSLSANGDSRAILDPVSGSEPCNCNVFVKHYRTLEARARRDLMVRFLERLRYFLDEGKDVIVTAEMIYRLLWTEDEIFFESLNDAGADREINVVYYIRPQDTAMESAWTQWGFRMNMAPSRFLAQYENALHYHPCYSNLTKLFPNVTFSVRPYRIDLLEDADIIRDFEHHVLHLGDHDALPADNIRSNTSLPLKVVNLLREMPDKLLWESPHDNARLARLKYIVGTFDSDYDVDIERSRRILNLYCYSKYEKSNIELIKDLEWNIDHFISPPDNTFRNTVPDIEEIDNLWQPKASHTERELLCRLLRHIFERTEH